MRMSIDAVRRQGISYVGKGVEIKSSRIQGAGNGLFAQVAFNRNDYITEYDGYYIDRDVAESLRKECSDYITHFRTLDSRGVISGFRDPKEAVGYGGASFANDSRNKDINSKFEQVWDKYLSVHRVFLRATRRIEPGDEIYVKYGTGYWSMYE